MATRWMMQKFMRQKAYREKAMGIHARFSPQDRDARIGVELVTPKATVPSYDDAMVRRIPCEGRMPSICLEGKGHRTRITRTYGDGRRLGPAIASAYVVGSSRLIKG